MDRVSITNFRNNIFSYVNQAVRLGGVLSVSAPCGNVVMLSEDEYNSILETVYLMNSPQTHKEIIEGMQTPLSECVTLEELDS